MPGPRDGSDLPSMRVNSGVSVGQLLAHRRVMDVCRLIAGAPGLQRHVDHPRIQKAGLALVGHLHGVVPTRVQLLGETEITYLQTLDSDARRVCLERLFEMSLALVVVSRGIEPPPEIAEVATRFETPVVVMQPRSSRAIQLLHQALDDLLAPFEPRHGVLIDIHGIGTLLTGPSGIGKSECALFLVERGHRLVADDQVELTALPSEQVIGRAPPLLRNLLELRGVGIINVRDLFGATAVRADKTVQLVVELCPWDAEEEFERLGLDDLSCTILGVEVPMLRIPVRSGRNMAVILEVAARNHILKASGQHSARNFVSTLAGQFESGESEPET